LQPIGWLLDCLTDVEAEQIVGDHETSTSGGQNERLRKHERVGAVIDEQFPGDENDDAAVHRVGLIVRFDNLVLYGLEGELLDLLYNAGYALKLFSLEWKHGLVAVQGAEAGSVRVEGAVVVLGELLTDLGELGIDVRHVCSGKRNLEIGSL